MGRAVPGLAGTVCGKMRTMRILGIFATMAILFRPQMVPVKPLVQPPHFYSALSAATASEWSVFRRFCAIKSGIHLLLKFF
jgi:hypothetical protein